jgi:hypothetical protein
MVNPGDNIKGGTSIYSLTTKSIILKKLFIIVILVAITATSCVVYNPQRPQKNYRCSIGK